MSSLKERKLKVAKENREEILKGIKEILASKNTRMNLKEAMEAFLSVSVKEPENVSIFIATGYQKVEKESDKMCKRMSAREYYSDRPEIFRQLPSSMR